MINSRRTLLPALLGAVVLAIGASLTRTGFAARVPAGKTVIHATLDPNDINKDIACQHALVGDADLILQALIDAIGARKPTRLAEVTGEIAQVRSDGRKIGYGG